MVSTSSTGQNATLTALVYEDGHPVKALLAHAPSCAVSPTLVLAFVIDPQILRQVLYPIPGTHRVVLRAMVVVAGINFDCAI